MIATEPQFLRTKQVMQRMSISRPTIYRLMAKGEFPQSRRLGVIPVWVASELDAWAADRIKSARQYVRNTPAPDDDFKDLLG